MIPIKMAMYHIFRHTQMRFSSFSMHFLSFSLVNFSVWCAMRRPRQSFYHDLVGHSWRMGRLCYVCLNWFGRVCWDMPRLCLETDGKYAWDSSILSAYRRLPQRANLSWSFRRMAWERENGRLDEYRGLEFLGLGQRREDEKTRRRRDQQNRNENGRNKRRDASH